MLIRFVVENFLSFDKETEFNMIAGNFRNHSDHVTKVNGIDVLSTSVLYGSNGAGKSNLIKAIDFFMQIIREDKLSSSVNSKKFKFNNESKNKSVKFEIEFSLDNKIYTYGLEIDNSNIIGEWLYETGLKKAKLIFTRELKNSKQHIKFANKYLKSQKNKLLISLLETNILLNSEILLGKSEMLKILEIQSIRNYLSHFIVIYYPNTKFGGLEEIISDNNKNFLKLFNDMLASFDTGLKGLEIEHIDIDKYFGEDDLEIKNKVIEAFKTENIKNLFINYHKGQVLITRNDNNKPVVNRVLGLHEDSLGNKVLFELIDESDGTKRLIDLIPFLLGIIKRDITFIVDEIDQSLHPSLLLNLVNKLINESKIKGQFIFTTHESNLLNCEIFRQDEIWFAEKDKNIGSTNLYSLEEFSPRSDLDIRKGYLKGRFGAIPFLANLKDLKWENIDV